jgi:hypothetical protein
MFESQTPPYHPFIFKTYSILPSELSSQSLAQTDPKLSVFLRKSPSEHLVVTNVLAGGHVVAILPHLHLAHNNTSQITTKVSKNDFISQKHKCITAHWADKELDSKLWPKGHNN